MPHRVRVVGIGAASATALVLALCGATPSLAGSPLSPAAETAPSTAAAMNTGATASSSQHVSLAADFNNVGISDDDDPSLGALSASGRSYSAEALADAGLAPGAMVTYDHMTFTWPGAAAGTADNVTASGQTIAAAASGARLAFLGAAVGDATTATGTVHYSDGSTTPYSLSLQNWWHPEDGGDAIATMDYQNSQSGQFDHVAAVYLAEVPLDPTKTVTAVTLPSASALHIFAMSIAGKASLSTSMTVYPSAGLGTLSPNFVGLSLEPIDLVNPGFHPGTLVQYLKTLGTGVLRLGGNSVDETFFTASGEAAPNWSRGTITPADLRALADVVHRAGWSVILGVNLKHPDAARAAEEVRYAHSDLGPALVGVEIGNEPNYYLSEDAYQVEFDSYVAAIDQVWPHAPIVGPSAGHAAFSFLRTFAENQGTDKQIATLTHHWYSASACGGATATIPGLLSASTRAQEKKVADLVVGLARSLAVPAVMDETNSVNCEGTPGVSDTFASALWSLDYGLLLAREGIQAADFHGTIWNCGAPKPNYMYYTPLCAPTVADAVHGDEAAQPEYYGLLTLHQVGAGQFLAVRNPASSALRTYAIRQGKQLTLVIVNVQTAWAHDPAHVTLDLGRQFHRAMKTTLSTGSRAGLAATSDVMLGGQQVSSSGTITRPVYTSLPIDGRSLKLDVDPASAVVIHLGDAFTVFDGTTYGFGALGHGTIQANLVPDSVCHSLASQNGGMPSEDAWKTAVRSVMRYPSGPLVLDCEQWYFNGSASSAASVERKLAQLQSWARQVVGPRIPIGWYGLLDHTRASNREYYRTLLASDPNSVFFPSDYTFSADRAAWTSDLLGALSNAHAIDPNVQVYPFVWPQYHSGASGVPSLSFMPAAQWSYELNTAASRGADGVIVWGGLPSSGTCDASCRGTAQRHGWYGATLTFLREIAETSTDLAEGKAATASSVVRDMPTRQPGLAVDADPTTRWASAYGIDPSWLEVDLGAEYWVTSVRLDWDTAYATAFQIQTSDDGSTWTTLYRAVDSPGGDQWLTGLSGQGRYIRMFGTERATRFGYALNMFSVFGAKAYASAPTVSISGDPLTGNTLTADVTADSAPQPDSYAYQWFSNGTAIDTGTMPTYTVPRSDAGDTLTVQVTPVLDGYGGGASRSAPVTVTAAPFTVLDGTTYDAGPIGHGTQQANLVPDSVCESLASAHHGIPSETGWKAAVQKAMRHSGGPLVLDCEQWYFTGSPSNAASNERRLQTLQAWARQVVGPHVPIGWYGLANNTSPSNYSQYRALLAADPNSVFFPSDYTFSSNESAWASRLAQALSSAHAIDPGVRVYPFVWPQYHSGSSGVADYAFMPRSQWADELHTALAAGADGVIIWGGIPSSGTCDAGCQAEAENEGWYSATLDYLAFLAHDPADLALGTPAIASSVIRGMATRQPGLAVDDDPTTRWASDYGTDPSWLQVDLGADRYVGSVMVLWDTAYGSSYEIQVSDDGTNWSTIDRVTNGTGGGQWLGGLAGPSAHGRYVRVLGTSRGTRYGYAINTLAVYAPRSWRSTAVYHSGDVLSYHGSTWEAMWWTQNQVPGDPNGPWEQMENRPDGTPVWTPSRVFTSGDAVVYHDHVYVARWWTRNQKPGSPNGPWNPAD